MDEQEMDLLSLIDEDGNELEFEILDVIEREDGVYYALLPTETGPESMLEPDTYYIFEVVVEDGEEQLAKIEDEEKLDELAEIFEARFDEIFEAEEEDTLQS